ncbi:unnamed protein product [Cylindrotheca closterium]|uniref:PDZ domain-containing protein n=1 Tax=Cylindrotheca closterium TaxID=2856 RepID=A0AAD2CJ29_9STRA|nr:unnamed protein product [Cylindrotheca closterium]
MPRRKKDVLDQLCSSMEIFMCGSEDFNKFRSRATGTATAKPASESSPADAADAEQGSAPDVKPSGKKVAPKKVVIMTPTDDDDILEVERDPVSVSIRKASREQPTHLELVSFYEKSGIYIKTIKPESKFHGTKIEAGMKLIRINGMECPATVKETFEYTAAAYDVLTVTAVVVESQYGEEDFMFKEIKLDDDDGKNLVQAEGEKEEKAPSPTRVSTDWFGGYLGKKGKTEEKKAEESRIERKERIKNVKQTTVSTERDRIGLGFADRVLKNLGVLEQDEEDNDSLDDSTYKSAPTLDDTTYKSSPTFDDNTYNDTPTVDDDDYTLSTTGGTTIIDSSPIIAKIFKKTKQDNLGLHFVSFKKKQGIYVYRIHEESRFLSTKLEPGMKLLAINDQPCPATVAETLALVQNIEGDLSIRAHHPSVEDVYIPEPPTKTVTAQQKVDDLTRTQAVPVLADDDDGEQKGEQKTPNEKEEATSKGDEDANVVVGQPKEVQNSITDAVEDGEKEDDEKEAEAEKVDETEDNNEEDDNESSTYESLPPPKNEP